MHTYTEVIDYLYSRLPMFTRDGASAFKKDLDNTLALCEAFDHPQNKFKTIHVAGTNGKGSSSHMLAAILASAGYKTGLYTSPHLVDFRERIRINGEQIAEQFVVDFVNNHKQLIDDVQPSFFETTVVMAFDYFAKEQVDIAIIEVGLGGRLDSTNVISPEVCLITNIGMDHMNLLGDTLEEITAEKAGIIKPNTPVVISETNTITAPIFEAKAEKERASITFADQKINAIRLEKDALTQRIQITEESESNVYNLDLTGSYQVKNIVGVLGTIVEMRKKGFNISEEQLAYALGHVQELTGFQGRWQTLSTDPFIICDTGHNEDGIKEVIKNLNEISYTNLHIVIGAMKDKDLDHMLPYLPKEAIYYFSNPDMPRAMHAAELAEKALTYGLKGKVSGSVIQALEDANEAYKEGDLIFVGGSNFVVAEVLQSMK
ncbi:bifunctional folylpolyglutamate synthase/dihydrofolate synthase [Sphingobacterium bovistauri]|uniref:Dihydrofolate synthase/folylpolyglutamate synthase n=1 Tax=Sphingobacterium bovistauri TaxID=2781959 RepID=A0ABS7Z2L7_9SPHI|nr:folylpolyglutamate synthase/dihydrofolate synthase family protein [Sphingobacterium bovistauri]MCA5004414.1 bifunctional folylpolyglutamate synthase/dihydrofolate synthase [Sphingobacterium bovistauri]